MAHYCHPISRYLKKNVQAIQKAQDAGHIVMICSGRAPEDIKNVLAKTPLSCPLAGSNGTMVVADGKLLSQISINKENVNTVAQILNEKNIHLKFIQVTAFMLLQLGLNGY